MEESSSVLDQFVHRAQQLYSLPTVATQVLELAGNPSVDTRSIQHCVEQDPALTAKLLRVVNSSMYGLSRKVTDLGQALALVGSHPLKMLVLGFSLPRDLLDTGQMTALEHYWSRALTKAASARRIGKTRWPSASDDAFIAGLLQDLGTLVLLRELGEPYARFLNELRESARDVDAAHFELMGFRSAELTARLLESWRLPDAFVRAVRVPMRLEPILQLPGRDRAMALCLYLADQLAAIVVDQRSEMIVELRHAGDQFGLGEEELEEIVSDVENDVRQLSDIVGGIEPDELTFLKILADAQALMAEVGASWAQQTVVREAPEESHRQALAEALRDVSQSSRRSISHSSDVSSPQLVVEMDLVERVADAIKRARSRRVALSLVLIQYRSGASDHLVDHALDGLTRLIEHRLQNGQTSGLSADGRLAVLLVGCDRRAAVEWGRTLAAEFAPTVDETSAILTAGVATLNMPPRNYPPGELIAAAARCLNATSAGQTIRSIEAV